MRRARQVCVTVIALAAGHVVCGTWFGYPPDVHLGGVERGVASPGVRWQSWMDGSLAASVEPWLARRLGWRGLGIRTANQINYSLFRRPPASAGTPILIGERGWLYEAGYVQAFQHPPRLPAKESRQLAESVAALRRRCALNTTAFAFVIAPSKAEIYPEHLPPANREWPDSTTERTTARDQLLAALQPLVVPVFDAHAAFQEWKHAGLLLFSPGGTHWNHYAAQRVLESVWGLLRSQPAGSRLAALPALSGIVPRPPEGTDADLRNLLNLWHFEPGGAVRVPYPKMENPAGGSKPINLVVVGDSFAYTLIDACARAGIRGRIDFFYYARRHFQYLLHGDCLSAPTCIDLGRITPGQAAAHPCVEQANVLLLEINEILVTSRGWGFPAAVMKLPMSEATTGPGGAWRQTISQMESSDENCPF